MNTRTRRIGYLVLPLLVASLLFAAWQTIRSAGNATAIEEAAVIQDSRAAETVQPPSSAACQYDPASALNVGSDELVSFQDPMLGNPKADVTVVEFFDPNCSHCQAFHPVMKKVLADYNDQIRLYSIPFPLWEYSINQIEAMILADRQDKYYEMVDLQLAQGITRGMSNEQLIALADSLDMDTEQFAQALRNDEVRRRALYYRKRGQDYGISSTPTVAINGQVVASDSRTVDCLSQLIEQELNQ